MEQPSIWMALDGMFHSSSRSPRRCTCPVWRELSAKRVSWRNGSPAPRAWSTRTFTFAPAFTKDRLPRGFKPGARQVLWRRTRSPSRGTSGSPMPATGPRGSECVGRGGWRGRTFERFRPTGPASANPHPLPVPAAVRQEDNYQAKPDAESSNGSCTQS